MDFFISVEKIDEYCEQKGINISDQERNVIISIFSESDKKNLKNEEFPEGDNILDNSEQQIFFVELKKNAKSIFNKLSGFFDYINNKKQSKDYADVASDNFITIIEDSAGNNASDLSNLKYFLDNVDNKYLFDIAEKVNEKRSGDAFTGIRGFFRKIAEIIEEYDNNDNEQYKIAQYIKEKIIKYKESVLQYAKENNVKDTKDYEDRFYNALKNNDILDLTIAMDRLYERTLVTKKYLNDITNGKKITIEIKEPNGKIDENFAQGITGDCWFLSCIKSITTNKNALDILNDKISVQKNGENITSVTVNIQGKDYVISYEELINANEYSTGDLDVRAVEIAANRFRLENGKRDLTFGGKTEDGFELIFGKDNIEAKNYYFYNGDETSNYIKELQSGNYMSVIGTEPIYDYNEEYYGIDEDGNKIKIQCMHAYIAQKADDKYIYLINPWESNKVIKFELDKLDDAFGRASIIKLKNKSEPKEKVNRTVFNPSIT